MKPIGVGELLEYTKKLYQSDYILRKVCVRGEVAEVTTAHSGHVYFNIKDRDARLNCVLFRDDAERLSSPLQTGFDIEVIGRLDIYAPAGRLQFLAKEIEFSGEGALYKLFLQRRDLLEREGLFDMDKKKPLPENIRTVGVVTSTAGAAQHDFLEVARKRNPAVSVLLSPTRVQGKDAGAEIAAAFLRLDQRDDVDVIVLTRGGGSMEDLFCFNDEALIRTLAQRVHPVVSAVGHEVDTTLSDFVADLRAATPTHAAELIVEDRDLILQRARAYLLRIERLAEGRIDRMRAESDALRHRLEHIVSPDAVENKKLHIARLKERMTGEVAYALGLRREGLKNLRRSLDPRRMDRYIAEERGGFSAHRKALSVALRSSCLRERKHLDLMQTRIGVLGRQRTGPRVYVGGRVADSAAQLRPGDRLTIAFRDGSVAAEITEIERNDDEL